MLKPEVAKKQLEKWTVANGKETLVAALARLPAKLRGFGFALFDLDKDGKEFGYERWIERQTAQLEQMELLDQLSQSDRGKLFKLVFGPLAAAVELTCAHLKGAPYQNGFTRRAFRAPQRPGASIQRRFEWLMRFAELTVRFQPDVRTPEWLAAWASHLDLGYGGDAATCGRLFSAVIDAGGKQGQAVFDILYQSATNEHEIGAMGRHILIAFLGAAREDGWELMEKLLLAAQRQEGLRQAVLEAVDMAHPGAFRRMLRIIIDQKLARFSAVARAVDVWVGLQWDSASVKTINDTCEQLLKLLESDQARRKSLQSPSAEEAFFGLWALAFDDVDLSLAPAIKLASHREPAHRLAAAYHLRQTELADVQPTLVKLLDDPELLVALQAMSGVGVVENGPTAAEKKRQAETFAALERLFQRMPERPVKLKPLVWPWTAIQTDRAAVAASMVTCLGDLPPSRLIPYLREFDPRNRARVCEILSEQKKWDNETRESLVSLIGDPSPEVRRAALGAFAKRPLTPAEAERVEGFLTRTASDLRQGAVKLLLAQNDSAALASTQRLTASKAGSQRLAGLELLRELVEADRKREACLAIAHAYRDQQKRLSKEEETQLKALLTASEEKLTLENGLGLYNPAERSPRIAPKKQKTPAFTPAAVKLLQSLDDLIHKHRDEPIQLKNWGDEIREEPLGGIRYGFPLPKVDRPVSEQFEQWPLASIWLSWEKARPAALRDSDGAEFLRADILLKFEGSGRWRGEEDWLKQPSRKELARYLIGSSPVPELKYERVIDALLFWLIRLRANTMWTNVAHDVCETIFALIPAEDHQQLLEPRKEKSSALWYLMCDDDWREQSGNDCVHWLEATRSFARTLWPKGKLPPEVRARQWKLQHWLDEPVAGAARKRPEVSEFQAAYDCGCANFTDLMDQLLGPDDERFYALATYSSPRVAPETAEFLRRRPEVAEAVDRIRERLLAVELARGDLPTPATQPVAAIKAFWGVETLIRSLTALGKERFKQARYSWRASDGRAESLTGIVQACYPWSEDDSATFNRLMKAAVQAGAFAEEKVLQLAFLAPQWTQLVKGYYGWEGLDEGLYWFLAHMQFVSGGEEAALAAGVGEDDVDQADEGANRAEKESQAPKLSAWERLVLERTPLTAQERQNGVVDVAWFHRTFAQLGRKRWEAIAEASRFAATGAQAKRAQFIADVLLGNVKKSELISSIRERKLKEQVRLLGLLPLAAGAGRDADLLDRYQILQEYKKYAKGLSSLSRPSAEMAAEIGLQNLARLAGYPDPLRMEWAMEAEATQDLLRGPVVAKRDDVVLTLSLDERAQPQVSIARAGKPIKSLPKTHKDEAAFVELLERNRELKRQASRVRGSLEAAMLRGDEFTGGELAQIARHALLKPMLERLVLIGEGIMGYPDKQGKVLRDYQGALEPVKKNEKFRVAHTWDLFASKNWEQWQRECFRAERLQPFKQVFRELYVATAQEKKDRSQSRRYAGQQVNPRQANALWGQRGWNVDGGVFKVFHLEGITATVNFSYGVTTPLEVEGLTLETVRFVDRDYRALDLEAVPPRIFSEVMRDLDLVVSVAHRGGVDPEASASTVEMRSALLLETCALLGIKNVKLNKSHAVIKGQLGEYTVHLGSAVVHRLPGGAVCLVPVHAQHRGRLFLPFADDDPKTAEVLSKTLLLAKDHEILDPTILAQLRA